MKLALNALIKFLLGLVFVGLLLFLPAGSFSYLGAWLFIALLFLPMLVVGAVLLLRAPKLLEKRLDAKEKESSQASIVVASGFFFLVGFIVAGLDYRFGWSSVPTWLTIVCSIILITSYALYAEVMRENEYLSRTIEVQADQKVIDTGLYGIVRHPMYAVTVLMFLSIPIVLGSFWAFLCFLPYVVLIVMRLQGEEKLLEKELSGYSDYKKRVKYRLFPLVW